MGDFSKILKIKNIFFNENFEIRSPMENIPSDSSVDYFPNEWLYKETIQKKIQNNPEYKSIIPFLLKFSIDNFISFIPYNEFIQCNKFLKFKKVIEQENFCISKWKNNFLFHGFSFNKNQSAKIVIKSVIDDYFFKEKLNKIFLIEGAEIKGIIYQSEIKGKLLNELLKRNPSENDKLMIIMKLISKFECYNKTDYCDFELRSIFVTNKEELNIIIKYYDVDEQNKSTNKILFECLFIVKLLFHIYCNNDIIIDNPHSYINEIIQKISENIYLPDNEHKKELIEWLNKINMKNKNNELLPKDIDNVKCTLCNLLTETDKGNNSLFQDKNFSMISTNLYQPTLGFDPKQGDGNNLQIISLVDFDDEDNSIDIEDNNEKNNSNSSIKVDQYFTKYSSKPPKFTVLLPSDNISININSTQNQKISSISYFKLIQLKKKAQEIYDNAEKSFYSNNFSQSSSLHSECLNLRKRYLGDNYIDTIISEISLGDCLFKQGYYKESVMNYLLSIEKIKDLYSDDNALCASLYHKIGLVYDLLNQYEKALECYKLSVNLKFKYFGKNNISTANTYYNIAGVYESLGKYTESLHYFFITLEIYLTINENKESFDCSTVYCSIALVYDKINNNEDSIKYYTRAIKIASKFQSLHPLIAICYNNLGLIHFKTLNYNLAIEAFKKSISILNELKQMKIGNFDAMIPMNNLAAVYFKDEQFVLSHDTYMKCIEEIGDSHSNEVDKATVYNNIGLIQVKWHKYKEGIEFFDKALRIREKYFNHKSIYYYGTLINKATALMKMKQYNLSISIYDTVFGILNSEDIKKESKTVKEILVKIYGNLGQCYLNLSNKIKCLEFFEKENELIMEIYGEGKKHTARGYLHLARYYQSINDKSKFRLFLNKCISAAENANGSRSLNASMFSQNGSMIVNVEKLKEEIQNVE